VNLRRLRLVGIVLGDAGIALAILTFIVRLDSIVRLVAVILIIAGVALLFRWSALKASEGLK
jgi:anaerobic C4-dicarboxylate transporter